MYLSRVEIDIKDRRKIHNLVNVQAYHSWVEDSFPEDKGANRQRKLWRVDNIYGKDYLLLVSPEKPDLHILEKYGVEGTAETKDYTSFLQSLKKDGIYRFKADLNPVHSIFEKGSDRGKVVPHVSEKHQKAYFFKKMEKHGFYCAEDEVIITSRESLPFKRKGQKYVNLVKVTYEGVLRITDVEKFVQALTEGIGRKKAFGCGMITVVPVE